MIFTFIEAARIEALFDHPAMDGIDDRTKPHVMLGSNINDHILFVELNLAFGVTKIETVEDFLFSNVKGIVHALRIGFAGDVE